MLQFAKFGMSHHHISVRPQWAPFVWNECIKPIVLHCLCLDTLIFQFLCDSFKALHSNLPKKIYMNGSRKYRFVLQVVRSRLQEQGYHSEKQYAGVFDCIKKVFQKEGMPGFYRGCATNLLRTTPAAVITFTSFEMIHRFLVAVFSSWSTASHIVGLNMTWDLDPCWGRCHFAAVLVHVMYLCTFICWGQGNAASLHSFICSIADLRFTLDLFSLIVEVIFSNLRACLFIWSWISRIFKPWCSTKRGWSEIKGEWR